MSERVQLHEYEVISIKPLIVKINLKDENVTLMVYLIPNVVFTENDKVVSVVSNSLLTVLSDKPKMGELCSPQKMMTHTAIIPELKIISEGGTEIRVNEKKVVIKAKIMNINIYPDLRDNFGNPCVNITWIQLMNVE
ncbi:hypothetical protein [Saccharolobus caldissimus]|uniref:Uncharacterized protein n=1 Tax=Saccharolobus caldissimus TaxID=1702097 RepID=A0AAQ4CSD1_9CREN|nr:hypothetical protein [Saccharolobus caldissimus]BDB98712.1 hypothetical protein SACC_17290 [Saccharolobus caldissimus]